MRIIVPKSHKRTLTSFSCYGNLQVMSTTKPKTDALFACNVVSYLSINTTYSSPLPHKLMAQIASYAMPI